MSFGVVSKTDGVVASAARRFIASILIWLLLLASPALAQERLRMTVENFDSYGRIVLNFSDRLDLPAYELTSDNNILTIQFEEPVTIMLPDLSGTIPQFVAAARVDPDRRGIRVGLKGELRISKAEAGELLFIDILPEDWVGIEPGLPREVVEELSKRARNAAIIVEQRRKAEFARLNRPTAIVSVGQHPTFTRLVVEWSIDVKGEYKFEESAGTLEFDWPVEVDLHVLKSIMPPELVSIENSVSETGSTVKFETAEGVKPRFYATSSRKYFLDFDSLEPGDPGAVDLASLLSEGTKLEMAEEAATSEVVADDGAVSVDVDADVVEGGPAVHIAPYIDEVGSTLRVVFPFERETPAAVFRRGDVVWMVFDTGAVIGAPADNEKFSAIASNYSVVPSGSTSIVRMHLSTDRLATLGSEGRSWVLSLGDILLAPAELLSLARRQNEDGLFEIITDLVRPYKVHELRDPDVGDILDVVTVYPPARGIVRDLSYVDFSALRSVHGLVVQPLHDEVSVRIEDDLAVISAARGLVVSTQVVRDGDGDGSSAKRDGFIDFASLIEADPGHYLNRLDEIMKRAADAEPRAVDATRLELARFYLANQFSYESIGILDVLSDNLTIGQLEDDVEITRAAALTMAGRADDALKLLNSADASERNDGLIWRSLARAQVGDFEGARKDALTAEDLIENYPPWVRKAFLLSGVRAAIEAGDGALASRFVGLIETSQLDINELSEYRLLLARVDEMQGRLDEALDTLGQVIAADTRPTRAEAVYRTMLLLDRMGRLDATRAADTLASEVVVWRGNDLEAKMLELLADLQFRTSSYREAFETVRALAHAHPDLPTTAQTVERAKNVFADLYLNGQADSLQTIDALTLYYDFRNLTPSGVRGDEMIRNLARRLVKVDLLEQAGELLQYQIDNRLEGAAKAQIATDLAIIHVANRSPQKALAVLSDTRVNGLPPGLERQRRVLEARALVDAGREELALDILTSMDGRDADLLRVDAHWRGKRYGAASETLEKLYGPAFFSGQMTVSARVNIVRAAVGFVLADDRIGLSRLRAKFGGQMSTTPEWPMFDFVTGEVSPSSLEFRKIAKEVAGTDSLKSFLASYREIYGGNGALAPAKPSDATGA